MENAKINARVGSYRSFEELSHVLLMITCGPDINFSLILGGPCFLLQINNQVFEASLKYLRTSTDAAVCNCNVKRSRFVDSKFGPPSHKFDSYLLLQQQTSRLQLQAETAAQSCLELQFARLTGRYRSCQNSII